MQNSLDLKESVSVFHSSDFQLPKDHQRRSLLLPSKPTHTPHANLHILRPPNTKDAKDCSKEMRSPHKKKRWKHPQNPSGQPNLVGKWWLFDGSQFPTQVHHDWLPAIWNGFSMVSSSGFPDFPDFPNTPFASLATKGGTLAPSEAVGWLVKIPGVSQPVLNTM